jgi:hypothetical protein
VGLAARKLDFGRFARDHFSMTYRPKVKQGAKAEPPPPQPEPQPKKLPPPKRESDVVQRCAKTSGVETGTTVRIRYWREEGRIVEARVVDDREHPTFAKCIAKLLEALPEEKQSRDQVVTVLLEAP